MASFLLYSLVRIINERGKKKREKERRGRGKRKIIVNSIIAT